MELQEAADCAHRIQAHTLPDIVRVDYGPLHGPGKARAYAVIVHVDRGDHTECEVFLDAEDLHQFLQEVSAP